MKNIHIATFTMPIAYITGKWCILGQFRPTRLPTPLKLGKHRLTARFTNYILHQFNSFSGYSFLDSSSVVAFSFSIWLYKSALRLEPFSLFSWSPRTVVSGQNENAGHFSQPTAKAMGQIVMWFTPLDNGFESQRNFAHPVLKWAYWFNNLIFFSIFRDDKERH